jgi:hypothetical protein
MVGDPISDVALGHVLKLPALQKVYLYQTNVTGGAVRKLITDRPKLEIDTGGYVMPPLVTDTMVFKGKS